MPTCLPACAAPAKPPAPRSLQRQSTACIRSMETPAASVRSARASITAAFWTWWRWMRLPTTVWTISATCATKQLTLPAPVNIRYTSSMRCTCCPQRHSMRCSKRWKNRLPTSSLFWQPLRSRRCPPPFFPAASGTILPASGRRISPAGWNTLQVRKSWSFRRTVRN